MECGFSKGEGRLVVIKWPTEICISLFIILHMYLEFSCVESVKSFWTLIPLLAVVCS